MALLSALIFSRTKTIFGVSASVSIFFLSAALMAVDGQEPSCDVARHIPYTERSFYTFSGTVSSEPFQRGEETVFYLQVASFETESQRVSCCGNVQVFAHTKAPICYGDGLLITAKPKRMFSPRGRGRRLVLRPESFDIQKQQSVFSRYSFKHFALRCKDTLERILYASMAPVPAGVVSAMVLGERSGVPARMYQSMVETGTVHILVVSGLNTGIVIAILILCLKLCLIKRRYFFIFAGPFLALYSIMTGASAPVVRAAAGAFMYLLAFSLQRQPNIEGATFGSLIVILVISPGELFGIGTQLSFGSVLSIVYGYPPFARACRFSAVKNKALLFCCQSCGVTLCAWFGTSGIIAYHYGIVSFVTVPANLFIVPLGTLTTVSGFITILSGVLCKPLSPVFAGTCELLIALTVHVNSFFARLPFACIHLN